jgi:hypothetical protein
MDNFTIIFIVVASVGIFLFWKMAKYFYKKLVGAMPKTEEGKEFIEGDMADDIARKFALTVAKLEAERVIYYNKTNGLFRRAFLRTWIILAIIFVTLGITLSETNEFDIVQVIGPSVMAALLSLIGGGIYTLVKKGTNLTKFTSKLKQELVTEIVKTVNPSLTFYDEGIDEEEFNKADIFPDGKSTSLRSEDKIEGTIEDTKVVISECIKTGRGSSSTRTNIKVKGITISHGSSEHHKTHHVEYFRGLFIQLDMKNMRISAPLKVIPAKRVRKEVKTGIDVVGRSQFIKPLDPDERIESFDAFDDKPYEIYCSAKDEAAQVVNETFIKVLDFVYNKYYKKRDSNDSNSIIGKMLFRERGLYITLRDDKLYIALDWLKDMFEPDMLLKKNLEESGIAQEIYEDLMFIDQVIKEVNLFNKVAV